MTAHLHCSHHRFCECSIVSFFFLIYYLKNRESFSIRRKKPSNRGTWNIYVLEKKPVVGMFKQFVSVLLNVMVMLQSDFLLDQVEFATSLGEGSPPMIQHHLSEAHILLRSSVCCIGNF